MEKKQPYRRFWRTEKLPNGFCEVETNQTIRSKTIRSDSLGHKNTSSSTEVHKMACSYLGDKPDTTRFRSSGSVRRFRRRSWFPL